MQRPGPSPGAAPPPPGTPVLHVGTTAEGSRVIRRNAVRAIVRADGHLLMLRSAVRHALAFPGGGVDPGETDLEALDRELREETGHRLDGRATDAVTVVERRIAVEGDDAVFEMVSRYFYCAAVDTGIPAGPDASERALGLAPEWVTADEATRVNRYLLERSDPPPWTARELAVLDWLADQSPAPTGRPPAGP